MHQCTVPSAIIANFIEETVSQRQFSLRIYSECCILPLSFTLHQAIACHCKDSISICQAAST